jgi:hypothetical protein
VSLQLTGDCWKEWLVDAALVPFVNDLHLPGGDVARS